MRLASKLKIVLLLLSREQRIERQQLVFICESLLLASEVKILKLLCRRRQNVPVVWQETRCAVNRHFLIVLRRSEVEVQTHAVLSDFVEIVLVLAGVQVVHFPRSLC